MSLVEFSTQQSLTSDNHMKFFRFLKRLLKPVWSATLGGLGMVLIISVFGLLSIVIGYIFHFVGIPILSGNGNMICNYLATGEITISAIVMLFVGWFLLLNACEWIKKEWDKS